LKNIDQRRVPLQELRRTHDPAGFEFECTDELVPLTELVGQDRALRSLQFGLGVAKAGYNIFVTGLTGTGKATAILEYIKRAVEERRQAGQISLPDDWCYVYNFDDPDRPNAIRLPPGTGRQLRDQLQELFTTVRANISRAFSSEEYEHQRRSLLEAGQDEAQAVMEEAQKQAAEASFILSFSPMGVSLLPMVGDKPMTPQQFAALTPAQRNEIQGRQQPIAKAVAEVGERLRAIEREVSQALREMDRRVAEAVMAGSFDAITALICPRHKASLSLNAGMSI